MLFWKSLRNCFFHIYRVYVLGMILQTCFSMFVHICLRDKTVHYWGNIREPVWSYIIDVCSSFSAEDFNACFSQIFEKRTLNFGYHNEKEESIFMTLRTFDSFCSSCLNFMTLNSSILLTVVTAYGLNQLGLNNNMWPLFVTEMHTNLAYKSCTVTL